MTPVDSRGEFFAGLPYDQQPPIDDNRTIRHMRARIDELNKLLTAEMHAHGHTQWGEARAWRKAEHAEEASSVYSGALQEIYTLIADFPGVPTEHLLHTVLRVTSDALDMEDS